MSEFEVNEVKKNEFIAEEKMPLKFIRYPEVDRLAQTFVKEKKYEPALLLNELTLARNLNEMTSKEAKQFGVVYAAFKGLDGKVTKRAGVYNTLKIQNAEDVEDILISEDFNNPDVLVVPRNSKFLESIGR